MANCSHDTSLVHLVVVAQKLLLFSPQHLATLFPIHLTYSFIDCQSL